MWFGIKPQTQEHCPDIRLCCAFHCCHSPFFHSRAAIACFEGDYPPSSLRLCPSHHGLFLLSFQELFRIVKVGGRVLVYVWAFEKEVLLLLSPMPHLCLMSSFVFSLCADSFLPAPSSLLCSSEGPQESHH